MICSHTTSSALCLQTSRVSSLDLSLSNSASFRILWAAVAKRLYSDSFVSVPCDICDAVSSSNASLKLGPLLANWKFLLKKSLIFIINCYSCSFLFINNHLYFFFKYKIQTQRLFFLININVCKDVINWKQISMHQNFRYVYLHNLNFSNPMKWKNGNILCYTTTGNIAMS